MGPGNGGASKGKRQQHDCESASPTRGHLERASQLVGDTVGRTTRLSGRSSVDDMQWLSSAVEALTVKCATELDRPLMAVVEALTNALKNVPTNDVGAEQSDSVKYILEVLKQLPRQDQHTMGLRLEPPTERMKEDECNVVNTFACALCDDMKESERAQAAKNAISATMDAIKTCIAHQESILRSVKRAQSHQSRVSTGLGDIKNDIQARLEQARKDVKSSEQAMLHARNNLLGHTAAVMEVVTQQKEKLLSHGEDETDATLDAHAAVIHSVDPKVIKMRQEREESQQLHNVRRQDVTHANARLEFYQELEAVLPSVLSTTQVELLKEEAERFVEDKLKLYMSKMIRSLRLYFEFHTTRHLLVAKEREKQKETLNKHTEIYDDLAPSSKKDIENKIRKFNGVIVGSTRAIREVASLQSELWEGKRNIFSPQVLAVVEDEYGKFWKALIGGAKVTVHETTNISRNQPVVSASDVPTPTTTPCKLDGRASHHPLPVRGLPPAVVALTGDEDTDMTIDDSNVIDLTGEEEGHATMDDSHGDLCRPRGEPSTVAIELEEKTGVPEVPPDL